MAHWQDRFLGIGELPPELSIFEIDFFQFSAPDIAAIRKEYLASLVVAAKQGLDAVSRAGVASCQSNPVSQHQFSRNVWVSFREILGCTAGG
jgi:hypothetical protein